MWCLTRVQRLIALRILHARQPVKLEVAQMLPCSDWSHIGACAPPTYQRPREAKPQHNPKNHQTQSPSSRQP